MRGLNKATDQGATPAARTTLSGYVLSFRSHEDGGLPELDLWFALVSRDGLRRQLEPLVSEEMLGQLLVAHTVAVSVLVVNAGEVVKTIDVRPFLWALYRGEAFCLGNPPAVERLLDVSRGESRQYLDRGRSRAPWSTVVAWEDLRRRLRQLASPVVPLGQSLTFTHHGVERRVERRTPSLHA